MVETLPLKTTHPATTMKSRIITLNDPRMFIKWTPVLGTKVWIKVTKVMTPMAIPRCSHSVAVLPLATTILDAKTMHPEANHRY